MELENKVCLIAGASGAIGASVATPCPHVSDRKPNILDGGPVEDPRSVVSYKLDITDREQSELTVRQIADTFSGLDVLRRFG